MNEFKRLTKKLENAQCVLEQLAGGESGMLDEGTTKEDIANLVLAIQNMADFLEDELGERLDRVEEDEVEDVVEGWLETAAKVDARRGEC